MFSRLRIFVRNILKCKEGETIRDCIQRKKTNLLKPFYKEKISKEILKKKLQDIGVSKGDSIIIHCAWREFYNYTGTPQSVIDIFRELVGTSGNIIMPCYGNNINVFDEKETPSAAGVLSEVFRKEYPIKRSICAHFSMAVMGPQAEVLVNEHQQSMNGFDEYSPYAKAVKLNNCKIILMGLGRYPVKFSLIHVGEYKLRNELVSCAELYCNEYQGVVTSYSNGIKYETKKKMITWSPKRKLNNKEIKKIYKNIPSYRYIEAGNLKLVSVNYNESLSYIENSLRKGIKFTI